VLPISQGFTFYARESGQGHRLRVFRTRRVRLAASDHIDAIMTGSPTGTSSDHGGSATESSGTGPDYQHALDTAARLLGQPLILPLGPGEPLSGADFRRLATEHTFGDSWSRGGLDDHSRALVSVTIAAALGTREPLRGQLRIALNNGVSKDEIVELFIHLEAYAGAARAFDSYQIALEVFAENSSA
jgi:4-carboxymuconolactone decarboxylase